MDTKRPASLGKEPIGAGVRPSPLSQVPTLMALSLADWKPSRPGPTSRGFGKGFYWVLAQIFFSLIANLDPKVKRILARFAQNHRPPNRFVMTSRRGSLTTRSADETRLKRSALRIKLVPLLDLNTNNSFNEKLARIATWLLSTAFTRRSESP